MLASFAQGEFVLLLDPHGEADAMTVMEALEMPDSFFTWNDDIGMTWGITFSTHRDDDTLGKSNWDAMLTMLNEDFGPAGVNGGDKWDVMHSSHWAVGWCDQIIIPIVEIVGMDDYGDAIYQVTPQFEWALKIRGALEDYPVLNDEDYSQREWDEVCEFIKECMPVNGFYMRRDEEQIWYEVKDDTPDDAYIKVICQMDNIGHVDDIDEDEIKLAMLELGYATQMKEEV